jgi:hypothetical protein
MNLLTPLIFGIGLVVHIDFGKFPSLRRRPESIGFNGCLDSRSRYAASEMKNI